MKKIRCFILLLMFLFSLPLPVWALDGSVLANWQTRDAYCIEMAATIPERKDNDGSFSVMGELVYMKEFSSMPINIYIKKNLGVTLDNLFNDKDDVQEIQALVEKVNNYYYATLLSGRFKVMPREDFTNNKIFEEANARNLYELFMNPDCGIGMSEGRFRIQIEELKIIDDYAKVIINREASVEGHNPYNGTDGWQLENGKREGYLLQKSDGAWHIENIIFGNSSYYYGGNKQLITEEGELNTFVFFEKSNDSAVWKKAFTFEKCPTKNYSSFGNYSEYIIGDMSAPIFNYEKCLKK
ncbi:MAG: hypothetical protein UDG94_04980 [Peptococcaceae bacterium]|nr:hypothetical protein [Peptococcaceae bacterium]